jgi:hypothetical protein
MACALEDSDGALIAYPIGCILCSVNPCWKKDHTG